MVLSVRELLVKQHTQLVNAVRGHAAEFGVIAAKGTGAWSRCWRALPTTRRCLSRPARCSPSWRTDR